MRGISVARRLINTRKTTQLSSLSSSSSSIYTKTLASSSPSPLSSSFTHPNASFHFPQFSHRTYCSSSPSGPSNIVLVESEEQFNSSIRKVKDNSQPAIYYFTAVWCPPCKLLSPIIGQLGEKYPHVTTYKIDIDHKELGNVLRKLDINSVPTLQFFHNGEKASEIVGADIQRIRDTMKNLYKKLRAMLTQLQSSLFGSKLVYADIFTPLAELATNPSAHGIYPPLQIVVEKDFLRWEQHAIHLHKRVRIQ